MKPYQSGCVYIDPIGSLAEMAQILGDILGVEFDEDDSGRYDEYPTYCAESDGADLQYDLLGIPGHLKKHKDELLVFRLFVDTLDWKRESLRDEDISQQLLSKIKKDGRLKAWVGSPLE
jgi:hypothetical protein